MTKPFNATEVPEWATKTNTTKGRLVAHIQFMCNVLKKERSAKDTYRAKLHRLRRDTGNLLTFLEELEDLDLLIPMLAESEEYKRLKELGGLKK